MELQVINEDRVIEIIRGFVGSTFAGLTTQTNKKLNKSNGQKGEDKVLNPFFGKVVSVKNLVGVFNYNYAGNVENARAKAGDDPSDWDQGESWYDAILDEKGRLTPFGRHKSTGVLYLRLRVLRYGKSEFFASETVEYDGVTYNPGDEIPREVLKPFIPKSGGYKNQNLKKGEEIEAITLKFESLRGLRYMDAAYKVEILNPNPPIEQRVEEFIELASSK